MQAMEIMKERHSVRQFTEKSVEQEKRTEINRLIAQINSEQGLNFQVFYDEPKCFDSFMSHYGKFSGVKNYITLVGKKSENLDEKLGYYGEILVLKLQELGLNSCWVALTHGKSKAVINKGEKQVCIIPFGYGKTQGVAHKNKLLKEVCNCTSNMPQWFLNGINAAMLAPTSMNQQKFFFELLPDNRVKAVAKKGFYTKVDLGIVKCHFEQVTEKTVE